VHECALGCFSPICEAALDPAANVSDVPPRASKAAVITELLEDRDRLGSDVEQLVRVRNGFAEEPNVSLFEPGSELGSSILRRFDRFAERFLGAAKVTRPPLGDPKLAQDFGMLGPLPR